MTPFFELGRFGQGFFGTLSNYRGPVDLVTGATAAYGLRKLRADYSGPAIRVRRSSDDTESDISFDADGALNLSDLLAFCGSGNGFVVTWYDQSGNSRHVSQATTGNQPRIVSAGVVDTKKSKPGIYFGGSAYLFNNTPFMYAQGAASLSMVVSLTAQANRYIVVERDSVSTAAIYAPLRQDSSAGAINMSIMRNNANSVFLSSTGTQTAFDGTLKHLACIDAGNNLAHFVNGVNSLNGSYTRTGVLTLGRFTIGCSYSTTAVDFITGHVSELIIYGTALSAGDRGTLQTDQSTYFSI